MKSYLMESKKNDNGIMVVIGIIIEDEHAIFVVSTSNHEERFGLNQAEAWAWYNCIPGKVVDCPLA